MALKAGQKDYMAAAKEYSEQDIKIKKKNLLIKILILVILILISIILCLTTFMYISNSNYPVSKATVYNKNDSSLKIISREEWQGVPAKEINPLVTPVPNVIILHTATETCTNQAKCSMLTRYIQYFHMESRDWLDIAYSFLVGGDGQIYEGRGWKSVGAFAHVWNRKSIGIGFIGTFSNMLPTKQQILSAKMLIEKGVQEGYIVPDYKLLAHRQVSNTESPGRVFYEDIQTWPHWTNKSYVNMEIVS